MKLVSRLGRFDSRPAGWYFPAMMLLIAGCSRPANEYVAPPAPSVTVMLPIQQNITRYIETNGETEAVGRAEVRARVRGFIEAIEFEPGQAVVSDTLLYQIEDDEYQASVSSAKAEVAASEAGISVAESQVLTAKAEADRAERELARQTTLLAQKATSQSEYDKALAANDGAKAMLAAAESAVDSAKANELQARARLDKAELDLKYTRVTAPIAGRVTKTDLKLGNLVEVGTELAAVIDDTQMYANFSISDRELLELRAAREQTTEGRITQEQWASVPVLLRRETDQGFPFEGRLNYVDQEGVDSATGTLSLRAIVDNSDGSLVTGLFVRIRMPVAEQPNAFIIPAHAVLQDRVGAFVLTVGDQNKVQRRDVQVGEQSVGWTVILSGLSPSEPVITEGLQRARPGAPVNPTNKTVTTAELPAAFQSPPTPAASTKAESPASDEPQAAPVEPSAATGETVQ